MALNFPANPIDGQVYGTYTYNATKGVWSSSNIPQAYTVSETVPSNPSNGDVWFNSTNAKSYVYYSDNDSSQWVEIGGQEGAPGTPSNLDAIPDVNVSGVADGNALIYDAASGNWIPGEGGGKFTVSDTAPLEAENGDTWFKSDDGKTYIYYVDADGGQWVEIASNTTGYLDIGQLNDVTIVSPTTGQALTYDGTNWVNATPASTLDSLTDVDTTGVADGQALVYDSATSEWIPGSAAPSGVNVLNSDTINVDFSDNVPLETRTVAGDVTFTGTNYTAGATKKILLSNKSTRSELSFPAAWNFIEEVPTALGPDKNNILELSCFGNLESNVFATFDGASAFEPIVATGGSESTTTVNGITYKIHTFGVTDALVVADTGSIGTVEYLVVAGGGGGGAGSNTAFEPGGGGAGGFLTGTLSLGTPASIPVTVGAGGSSQNSGSDSSFLSVTSVGGGYGATGSTGTGGNGGSGGGGAHNATAGGTGIAGQGNAGGNGSYACGGGGGGASEAGQQGIQNTTPANGGDGLPSSISGTSYYYAGGGAGYAAGAEPSYGGLGGGADKIGQTATGANGSANTGGGGSAGYGGAGNAGGSGGSGIVIIRYPITDPNI